MTFININIKKHLSLPWPTFFSRNSTDFATVSVPEINQNALIVKVRKCEKISNFPKLTRNEKNY